jgi:hypothetical protein
LERGAEEGKGSVLVLKDIDFQIANTQSTKQSFHLHSATSAPEVGMANIIEDAIARGKCSVLSLWHFCHMNAYFPCHVC